jgi:hypothetical protein
VPRRLWSVCALTDEAIKDVIRTNALPTGLERNVWSSGHRVKPLGATEPGGAAGERWGSSNFDANYLVVQEGQNNFICNIGLFPMPCFLTLRSSSRLQFGH